MNKPLNSTLAAAALVAMQILLFNNLQLRGVLDSFVAPSIYILYLIMLPVNASRVSLLAASFLLGLTVDLFSGHLGVHTAACVLAGFVRPSVTTLLISHEESNKNVRISIYSLGLFYFFLYAFTIALIFHLTLFFLEAFSFYELHITLLRTLLSSIAAVVIMILIEVFFERKK
ncbi:MAG: rod shape-determining protein MreD [Prevotellaceae bacterium]|jgi:rod shape-determining protein MreD|nr:rod shape-determining protein MreD [Prevotellaceae bacterium]